MSNQISSKHISYEVNACYIIFSIGSQILLLGLINNAVFYLLTKALQTGVTSESAISRSFSDMHYSTKISQDRLKKSYVLLNEENSGLCTKSRWKLNILRNTHSLTFYSNYNLLLSENIYIYKTHTVQQESIEISNASDAKVLLCSLKAKYFYFNPKVNH